ARQSDLLCDKRLQHTLQCAAALEQVEHQADGLLHLLALAQHHLSGAVQDVTAWKMETQLATLRLGATTLQHASLQDVQLGFAHGTLQAQQEPVIEVVRAVITVSVPDERVGQRADLEQLMPVSAGAG